MIEQIDEMAHGVATAWARGGYDRAGFPSLAADALAAGALDGLHYLDVIREAVHHPALPYQQHLDSNFGQPPLTVFWHPRFCVEVLFWATANTAVHDHGFCGAFRLLHGSTLQTEYAFDSRDPIEQDVRVGTLALRATRVLEAREVHPIHAGDRFIHAALHLTEPTVTLLVRTHSHAAAPQHEYHRPSLSVALGPPTHDRTRAIQLVRLLRRLRSPALIRTAAACVDRADAATCVALLREARLVPGPGAADIAALVDRVAVRFPRLGAALPAVLAEAVRDADFDACIKRTTDARDRLLLALVLTQPDLDEVAARMESAEVFRDALHRVAAIPQVRCGALPVAASPLEPPALLTHDMLRAMETSPLLAPLARAAERAAAR